MAKKSTSAARFHASVTALLSPDGLARQLRFRKHNSPQRYAQCEHLRSSDKYLAHWVESRAFCALPFTFNRPRPSPNRVKSQTEHLRFYSLFLVKRARTRERLSAFTSFQRTLPSRSISLLRSSSHV